jgi:hypothetical protein
MGRFPVGLLGDIASDELPLDETVGRQIGADLIKGVILMTCFIVY